RRTAMGIRILIVVAAILAWFKTQALVARRPFPAGAIGDRLHELTAPLNRWLHAHPRGADATLVASSAAIDALALFVFASAILGASVRPLVGVVVLFGLRQLCQGLCALPAPEGMIWRRPPVPSLLVTYDV